MLFNNLQGQLCFIYWVIYWGIFWNILPTKSVAKPWAVLTTVFTMSKFETVEFKLSSFLH